MCVFMCTTNKSAHTKKSMETYLMILVYTYQMNKIEATDRNNISV